jgi:hypothetical protein
MKPVPHRCWSAAGVIAVGTLMAACHPANYQPGTIEQKYYATGSWAVTVNIGTACCDSSGNKFDLFYPTNLGLNGFSHPIITWGNGTFSQPSNYSYLLKHFASWGFAVIATEDKTTGPGQTILDAANYLINANSNSGSIFFHKLNVNQIGACGHSQGAAGALNALIKSGGSIKTVIPIEIPAQIWCSNPANCDTSRLTSGSIFLIDGSADIPISPPTQDPLIPGLQSVQAYYDAAPSPVAKLKGTLIGPSHNDVEGQPDCTQAAPPCVNGVYGYLGYPTAWMMDWLQGDAYAHGAFVNGTGEMFSQTRNWKLVASNIP